MTGTVGAAALPGISPPGDGLDGSVLGVVNGPGRLLRPITGVRGQVVRERWVLVRGPESLSDWPRSPPSASRYG